MFDIQNALYIPGFGFSVTKTKDQSLGSPEADFAALMEEVRAAQEKRKAEEETNGVFTRAELTQEDIKELAKHYDPGNMTQEEYDSFLDDLIGRGVLEKKDLNYIDYRGDLIPFGETVCVGTWDFLENGPLTNNPIGAAMIGTLSWDGPRDGVLDITYRPTNADALAWAKGMSLWKPHGYAGPWLDAANKRYDIFTVLSDTLDAMQNERKRLGLETA